MIRLIKIANNLHKLVINHKVGINCTIWFSYETPIAFMPDNDIPSVLYIAKNQWSNTTGKHLNLIDSDKNKRIEHSKLIELMVKELRH